MWNENRKETMIGTAQRMIADGILKLEKIAKCVGLPLDEVRKLQTGLNS